MRKDIGEHLKWTCAASEFERWCRRSLALCMVYMLALPFGYATDLEAAAVKAAFLHRFAAYVEWPQDTSDREQPFTIAVLDDSRIASHLERLLPGLTIRNRQPRVRNVSSLAEIENAQIVFIGKTNSSRIDAVVGALRNRPVLIVTDHERGLAQGSVINFVEAGGNVRFEVSLPAAEQRRLKINAGLLSVAVRVVDSLRSTD
jgi:hypothetical protein